MPIVESVTSGVMISMKPFLYAAAAAIALTAAPASAKVVQFLITNNGGVDKGEFLFTLDDTRMPSVATSTLARFTPVTVRYFNVPGIGTGTTTTAGVSFFTSTQQGGLAINGLPAGALPFDGGTFQIKNTVLVTNPNFTGANRLPIYRLGTFQLSTQAQNSSPTRPVDNYTVQIAVVPEPATWGLMIAGFAVTGLGLRRRARPITA